MLSFIRKREMQYKLDHCRNSCSQLDCMQTNLSVFYYRVHHGRRSRGTRPPPPNIFYGPMLKPLNNYYWLCAFSSVPPPPPTLTRNRRRWGTYLYSYEIWKHLQKLYQCNTILKRYNSSVLVNTAFNTNIATSSPQYFCKFPTVCLTEIAFVIFRQSWPLSVLSFSGPCKTTINVWKGDSLSKGRLRC